jgi:transcriptional regulator with XRE-family HTH domain
MKLLKKLDALRMDATKLSRAEWLRSAGVAESSWYRWVTGENSPTIELLERLARQIDVEMTVVRNPPNVCEGPKSGRSKSAQAKNAQKKFKKNQMRACESGGAV